MDEQHTCGKCGSTRKSVIGQFVSSAVLYLTCADCGHTTTVIAPTPATMEGRHVARLVRGVLANFDRPFELLSVVDAAGGYDVIVRSYSLRVCFHLEPGAPSVLRAAIRRALDDAT